ncbi:DNA pilot protein [robinz microvirus RP_86]|nr:DNA pilot protein [robinz microvirus RP_86]
MPAVLGAAIGIPTLASKIAAGLGTVGKFISGAGGIAQALGLGGGGDRSNLERHAIARRVRDAQEAGIHPLFALGSSVGYSPVLQTRSAGGALSSLGNTVQSIALDAEAKRSAGVVSPLDAAQIRALTAQANRDEALAQQALSEVAKNRSAVNGSGIGRGEIVEDELLGLGPYQEQPAQVTAARPSDPSTAAGPARPGIVEYQLSDGSTVRLPDQNAMETAEGLSYYYLARDWWARVGKNIWKSDKSARQREDAERARTIKRWLDGASSYLRSIGSDISRERQAEKDRARKNYYR